MPDVVIIENIALEPTRPRGAFIEALYKLEPGQSFFFDTTYPSAHTRVQQAKQARRRPLIGEFRVIKEGTGSRIGRIS